MKVLAFNGSPREDGNTFHALDTVTKVLNGHGIEAEIIQVGKAPISGCLACARCYDNKNEKCVIDDGIVNECIQKVKTADGILLGSPVYYSSIAGNMKSFLDRLFYVAGSNGSLMRHKAGAAIAAVRRTGGSETFASLNYYFLISEMFVPASNYWNVVHGCTPGEVFKDDEGMQTMKVLGTNMALLLKSLDKNKEEIANYPKEPKIDTNFIR